nr:hybrid signal transduction histidine kinase M [Tanacetum cinerariifolium]
MEDRWFFDLNGDARFCVKDVRCLLDDVFIPKADVPTRCDMAKDVMFLVSRWWDLEDRSEGEEELEEDGSSGVGGETVGGRELHEDDFVSNEEHVEGEKQLDFNSNEEVLKTWAYLQVAISEGEEELEEDGSSGVGGETVGGRELHEDDFVSNEEQVEREKQLDFNSDEEDKPTTDDQQTNAASSSVPDSEWCKLDDLIKMWILGSLCDSLHEQVISTSGNAKDLWDHLQGLFHDNTDARAISLDNELLSITIRKMSINEYFTKFKSMTDRLKNLGSSVSENNLVTYAANGLDSRFVTIAKIIITVNPFQPLIRRGPVHQLDVKNAFLNGDLFEPIYMYQPPSFADSRYPHMLHGLDFTTVDLLLLLYSSRLLDPYTLLERAHMLNCNPSRTSADT